MINKYLKIIYAYIKRLFKKKVTPLDKKQNKAPRRKTGGIKKLLDDLDQSFSDMKRLTPKKSRAQRLIRKFGCYIPVNDDPVCEDRLDNISAYGMPSYICYFQKRSKVDGEDYASHLLIAEKTSNIPFVKERIGFIYYEVTTVIFAENSRYETCFYIQVDPDNGNVKPLKSTQLKGHEVKPIGRTFYKAVIDYPDLRNNIANEAACEDLKIKFIAAYNMTMQREYGINIIVKKGKDRATFTVPQNEWKYFFKDRIKVKTSRGVKPIFHAVKSHVRHTKKGDQNIKTHHRGLRHFRWGEYDITIAIQGKHGVAQASLNLTPYSEANNNEVMVDIADYSNEINAVFAK